MAILDIGRMCQETDNGLACSGAATPNVTFPQVGIDINPR